MGNISLGHPLSWMPSYREGKNPAWSWDACTQFQLDPDLNSTFFREILFCKAADWAQLRNISLSPDGGKLLATFCPNYCNRVEVYNIDELYQPGVATRLMCLLQVSCGPSSMSKTLYLSATLADLRLLEDDPTVLTTMITRGLRGPPTVPGGRATRVFLYRTVNNHLYLRFMIVI